MKYLIKLEDFAINNEPKFKVGDIVYYNPSFRTNLDTNKAYTIDDIEDDSAFGILYTLKGVYKMFVREDNLLSELEYASKQYNL